MGKEDYGTWKTNGGEGERERSPGHLEGGQLARLMFIPPQKVEKRKKHRSAGAIEQGHEYEGTSE